MKARKKILSLLLCAVMALGLAPLTAQEAQAEVTEPGVTQFATPQQLKGFDTDDNNSNGQNPAKVYFGKDNQQWWIAGVENDNLVLFAASPLARGIQFKNNHEQGTYEGTPVNANHYGASPLRSTTLKGLETSYFTSEEQKLMNSTTVSTKNTGSEGPDSYSTTDKLYLANGKWGDTHVSVGANNNLRIDKTYWGSDYFWLRAPCATNDDGALVADPDLYVNARNVGANNSVVPAFNFNLSSVIFASAAEAASSDKKLTVKTVNNPNSDGAFTLRHKSTSVGDATIGKGNVCVSISNVNNANTYLVAQNSEGAWAKKVKSNDIIFADEVDSSLTSFDKCKVWLETTDNTKRITSAKMATSLTTQSSHNVKVKLGDHMSITNGSGKQVGVNGSISEITVTADSGYYFPTDYNVSTVNGISVTKTSDTTLKISGTPNADTLLTLPAAAKAHEHSWTYGLKSGNADTIEATCNGAGPCTLSNSSGGSVTLNPPKGNITYDGNAKEATLTNNFAANVGLPTDIPIKYAKKNQSGGYEDISGEPKDAGDYKASITLGNAIAPVEFQIKAAALTGVSVKQTGTLTYNGKEQTAKVDPKATPVNNQPVTFTYSASESGTYTEYVPAFTEAGEHTVYYKATAPNHEVYTGSFKVMISAKVDPLVKVTGIKITGTSKKIAAGKKVKLQAAVTPANAENRAVVWTSSNKKVATVDSKGVVTVKKGSGGKKVTITATAADGSGVKASYKITSMKGAVKKIRITGAKSVKAGKSLKLKAKVTASKGANKTLTWKSSHTQYATVSSSGKVKTYKAGKGKKVKITATATDGSNKKKTVTIKIK